LLRTRVQPLVTIGGVPAFVLFSGVAPGFAGVLQLNARIPMNVAIGSAVSLEISAAGVTHRVAEIAVA
jgi:uncharacterized protein (TIGR03437 family)